MSTVKTAFGGGIPLVNLDEVAPIPCCFVLKLPDKLTPSDITDRFSEAMILDHVLDLQTLHADCLVLTNNASRELVLRVTPSIGYASMDTSDLDACLCTVLASLLLLRQSPLGLRQLLFICGKELGVAYCFTRREYHHRLEAQIKPNFLLHWSQMLDILFYQERDKVSIGAIFGDGDRCRGASTWQRSRPM